MNKIIALYINEMTKICRKVSSIIIILIMIVGVVGLGGLVKLQEGSNNRTNNGSNQKTFLKDNLKFQIEDTKARLTDTENQLKSATSEQAVTLEQDKLSLTYQIEALDFAIKNNININSDHYKAQALNSITSLKLDLDQYKNVSIDNQTDDIKKKIAADKAFILRYENIINNNDFKDYISLKRAEINSDTAISAINKKISLESLDLMQKYNMTGQENADGSYMSSVNSTITDIENLKQALVKNIDTSSSSPKLMTNEMRETTKNNLAVILYKLDKGMIAQQSDYSMRDTALQGMIGFGLFAIILLMLILAGGSVSSEFSTGSIKSLIISPIKRWKIFISKVLSLLTVGIIATILLYITVIIANAIFFGEGASYVYANNGIAHELNFYIYKLAYIFTNFLDVMVYMTFALMLSVITRNTAASVGLSIALYFGGSLANTFVTHFAKGEWLKFIPFNNLSLAEKIFGNDISKIRGGFSVQLPTVLSIPVNFSFCYIAVIILCMGYVALDSFNRRDIK